MPEPFDPNNGNTYYPPGLNPAVVKLFETSENKDIFIKISDTILKLLSEHLWHLYEYSEFKKFNNEKISLNINNVAKFLGPNILFKNNPIIIFKNIPEEKIFNSNYGENNNKIIINIKNNELYDLIGSQHIESGKILYEKILRPYLENILATIIYDLYNKNPNITEIDKKNNLLLSILNNWEKTNPKDRYAIDYKIWKTFYNFLYKIKLFKKTNENISIMPLDDVIIIFKKTFKEYPELDNNTKKRIISAFIDFYYTLKNKL